VEIHPQEDLDRLARHQSQLIDATVLQAEACLQKGQPGGAIRLMEILSRRKIPDRRVDEITSVCALVENARSLAACGRWGESTQLLRRARDLRPDLELVASRIEANQQEERDVSRLTHELREALQLSDWDSVQEVSGKILQIAPNYQIAVDARRRYQSHYARSQEKPADRKHIIDDSRIKKADTVHIAGDRETTRSSTSARRTLGSADPEPVPVDPGLDPCPLRSFMLWVDGVGGYLVCTRPQVVIGRAVEQSEVDIPIQADIRRRHLRIKRSANGYLAEPLDSDRANPVSRVKTSVLADGEELDLGGGVVARFSMPHPLGCSARIDLTSRHRTDPWSDAILLLGDALMIGPFDSHHVRSPRLAGELLLFRRGSEIVLRAPGEYERDGRPGSGDITVDRNLSIVGNGYSVSLEMVNYTANVGT
jgi:hypothetical protein